MCIDEMYIYIDIVIKIADKPFMDYIRLLQPIPFCQLVNIAWSLMNSLSSEFPFD